MRVTVAALLLAAALGGCAMHSGQAGQPSFDAAEIRAAERALIQALEAPDPTAWVGAYTEDAVFVAPAAPAAQGRAALLQMAKAMKPLAAVTLQPIRTEGSARLATVYAHGSWVSGRPPEAGSVSRVRLLSAWRKQADGQWRIAQELLHADPSAKSRSGDIPTVADSTGAVVGDLGNRS